MNGALFASFLPRLPEIRDRVDISVDRVGLLLSLAGLAGLAGSALVGPAIARFGTRAVQSSIVMRAKGTSTGVRTGAGPNAGPELR